MSEKLQNSGEYKHSESLDLAAESRKNLEKIHEKGEKSEELTSKHIEHAKSKVETQAISGKEYTVGEKESTSHSSTHSYNQKELKAESFNKTINHVRKKLPKSSRYFSKVIHNKKIESVSEVGAKTVARPSGILGGGIASFIGSALILYLAKHYGFEYNFFSFILLFIIGFFIGSSVEILYKSIKKPKHY